MRIYFRRIGVSFPILATLLIGSASAHEAGNGIVHCKPALQPVHAVSGGIHFGVPVDHGRFFAPTHRAMFFSHAGDRCLWRSGVSAKG